MEKQTFTAERLEDMLEQAGSLYGDDGEVRDPDQVIETIKVKQARAGGF